MRLVAEVIEDLEWFWHSLTDAAPGMRTAAGVKLDHAMARLASLASTPRCTVREREFLDRVKSLEQSEHFLAANAFLNPKGEK